MKRRVLVIANPGAGRGRTARVLPLIQEKLLASGLDFELLKSVCRGDALALTRRNARKFTDIVSVGGDGTLNEVVNGMAGSKAVLGVVSAGSGNDFIKSLGTGPGPDQELHYALNGAVRRIDLGVCNNRYFINGVGIGFDGRVAAEMEKKKGLANGRFRYSLAVLGLLMTYRERMMSVTMDGRSVDERLFMVTIGNGTTFGAGFRVTPAAKLDDGLLDVCAVRSIGLWRRLAHIRNVVKGTHGTMPEVGMLTAKRIRIEAEAGVLSHIDGEPFGGGPWDIRVAARAIGVRGR